MRDDLRDAPLSFPTIPVGATGTVRDLTRLLYKGGAGMRVDLAEAAISDSLLGALCNERLELVHAIHEYISGKLAGGGSPTSAENDIDAAVQLFAWADEVGATLTIEDVQATYLRWTDSLYHSAKVVKSKSERSVYTEANRIGKVLDSVLGRQKTLIKLSRLTRPKQRKTALGVQREKQNLQATFAFGALLQDVCDALTLRVVWEVREVQIPWRGGNNLVLWAAGSAPRRKDEWAAWEHRNAESRLAAYVSDRSLEHRGRKVVVNTRILAELLMFIGQTGMNLAQAHKLQLRSFSYSSDIDGYKVRDYKHRRGGEVLFEIFSEYRNHFERYLEWRREIFPDSDKLFPVIRNGSVETRAPLFDLVIGLCKQAGVPWTPPSALRGTRVNWLLRRSGDLDLTSEMAQHQKRMLLEVYELPSLQRTMNEVTRFWQEADPRLVRAAAPGACDGIPVASAEKPPTAPDPDCVRPSGCLWCEHHRDIDTQDYVWSMASFRHLKILEVSKHCFPAGAQNMLHPAQHSVDRLSQKLTWFKNATPARRAWVEEALARVEEGDYHGDWATLIRAAEGGDA